MTAALSPNVFQREKNAPDALSPTSATFHIENPLDGSNWDDGISRRTSASVFHSAAWARILSETYGFTPFYFTAGAAQSSAAMPLMEVRSWLTGTRGISLPFTDECPVIGDSDGLAPALVQEALRFGKSRGWKRAEFRGRDKMFGGAAPSAVFFGHALNLTPGAESLFARLDDSVRRAIRKAEKSGLIIEFSETLDAVSEFFSLHCRTRRRHGLPPQPFEFFRQIQKHILARKMGVVVTARMAGRAVASAVYFFANHEAIYKFGASDQSVQALRPNNLVMWRAIEWLAAKGVKVLRFGRTSANNEGLRRYKLNWGTEEYAIRYYNYDLWRDAIVPQTDDSNGWHNRFFRFSPILLNRLAGAVLYRHIA